MKNKYFMKLILTAGTIVFLSLGILMAMGNNLLQAVEILLIILIGIWIGLIVCFLLLYLLCKIAVPD